MGPPVRTGFQSPEQPLAERHLLEEILEQFAQVLLGPGTLQALPIAQAISANEFRALQPP